jgi:hypothetical protein
MNWIVAASALFAVLVAGVSSYWMKLQITRQEIKLVGMERVIKTMMKSHENTQHQLVELHAANQSLVTQLTLLATSVDQTAMRQTQIETLDPENKLYTRAVKMVELGADLNEVMRECELPKAEAELLFTLHGKSA